MNAVMNVLYEWMLITIRTGGVALVVAFLAELLVLPLNALRVRKRIGYLLLWVVLLRMVIPVSLPSQFSLFNVEFFQSIIDRHYDIPENGGYVGDYDIAVSGTEEYDEALMAGLEPEENPEFGFDYIYYSESENGEILPATTFREKYGVLMTAVWAGGVLLFWGYGIVSALLLKRRVATATIVEPGVYETDRITAPFILGIFKPVIYLPLGLDDSQREMILLHERMHLRWGDHIVKLVAYFATGLHWMIVWLGIYFYRILLEQMEEACDQDVLRALGEDRKADYGEALLVFSTKRQFRQVMTVAFSESWVKERIRQVLKYKKPLRWITVPALVVILAAFITLGTSGLVTEAALVTTYALTPEETAQTGLPGSVVRYELIHEETVRSLAFDLELWSSEGLVQRERILTCNNINLSEHEAGFGLLADVYTHGNLLTEWAFEMKSDTTLQCPTSLDWTIRYGTETRTGSLALPQQEIPAQGMFAGLPEDACSMDANDSAVLFCGLFSQSMDGSQVDCAALSELDTIPLERGQLAAVLRMRTCNSIYPVAISLHDLLPEDFILSDKLEIAAEGKSALLTGDSSKSVQQKLFDIDFNWTAPMGSADVADEGLPFVRLYAKDGRTLELTIAENRLVMCDPVGRKLTCAQGESLDFRSAAASIYWELGIEKSMSDLYQLPETLGETAFGWTLAASIPSKDIWLYSSGNSVDSMLIMDGRDYTISFWNNDIPYFLDYGDYTGDGASELLTLCSGENGQRLYFLTLTGDGEWFIDMIGQDSLSHFMETDYGEFVDNSNQFELVFADDYRVSHAFSKEEIFGDWADARHVSDERYTMYQDAVFRAEDGNITVSALRVLRMKKDDTERLFPCAVVSADIRYSGPNFDNETFVFSNFAIAPLDNR